MDTATLFSDVRGEIADARDLLDGVDDAPFCTLATRLDKVMKSLNRIGKYVEEIEHATARRAPVRALEVRAAYLAAMKKVYPGIEVAE